MAALIQSLQSRRYLYAYLIFALVAGVLRFWQLGDIPFGIYPDEAFNGTDALKSLLDSTFPVFYEHNNGREGGLIWSLALTQQLLEPSGFSLRLPSAVFGLMSVLVLPFTAYFLARHFNPNENQQARNFVCFAALAAMAFLLTSYWHLNFSRLAFRGILDVFFGPLSMLLIYWALRSGKEIMPGLLAGAVAALGLYGYATHKFMVFPILGVLIFAWDEKVPGYRKAVSMVFLGGLLVALPLLNYILNEPQQYFSRLSQISVFNTANPLFAFKQSLVDVLSMLMGEGDANIRSNLDRNSQLSLFVAVSFLAGGLWLVSNLLRIFNTWKLRISGGAFVSFDLSMLLFIWWFAMLVPPALTTEGQPNALRSIGLLAPTMIIAGLGAAVLFAAARDILRRKAVVSAAYLVIAILLVQQVATDYFIGLPNSRSYESGYNADARRAAELMLNPERKAANILVTDVGVGSLEYWPAQPVLFLLNGKFEENGLTVLSVVEFNQFQVPPDAAVFSPEHLLPRISAKLDASQQWYPY